MNPDTYALAAAVEEEHWWFVGRRQVLCAVLDHCIGTGKQRRVLEVGCGNGGNLKFLSRYGSVSAIELEDGARARAKSRGLARVEKGWLPDGLPFNEEKFDLVAALDVIEHVDDDLAALERLRGRLHDGGTLLLTVPAYPWLWSRHDELSHHRRRYTAKVLDRLLSQAGFRATFTSYFNTFLFPAGVAHIKFSALLEKNPHAAMKIPANPLNWMLRNIFGAESHFVPRIRLPFGISLVTCAVVA